VRGGDRKANWLRMFPYSVKGKGSQFETISIFSLYFSAFILIVFEFIRQDYDWDIDHEIYYGQQLLYGNLLWTEEFHDKLPMVQYFFALVVASGSPIINWRLISLFSAMLAIVCVMRVLPGVLVLAGHAEGRARKAALLSGGLFLLISSVMPGGFTHINVMSASMAIVAMLLGLTLLQTKENLLRIFITSISAGLAATISVSFRPYFFFPLAISFLITGFLILTEKAVRLDHKCYRFSTFVLFPVVLGVGLNLGPYLLSGSLKDFFSGLDFLLKPSPPSSSILNFFIAPGFELGWVLRFWLAGMLFYALAEIGINSRRGRAGIKLALIPLSAISLFFGILSQHFWSHYINLFSWYFAILLAVGVVSMSPIISPYLKGRLSKILLPANIVPIGLSILATFVSLPSMNKLTREHPSQPLVRALENRLMDFEDSRPIFFAPENMYVHWKLKEPRHGFPHSANTRHISRGLWEEIKGSYVFRHPKNIESYCFELLQSQVQVIVLSEDSSLLPCLSSQKKQWRMELILLSDAEVWYLWFRR